MTTSNTSLTSNWNKVANASDVSLLVSWVDTSPIEFAVTDADEAPTTIGHVLHREQGLTRTMIGAGYVWARAQPNSLGAACVITVSKSTTPTAVSLSSGNVSISGPITVANEVEITNDVGNAIPVIGSSAVGTAPIAAPLSISGVDAGGLKRHLLTDTTGALQVLATSRNCVGSQRIALTTAAVSTLTVPTNAVAAMIQADGGVVSLTLDGSTPSATNGLRIDDGAFYYVDTVLTLVKVIARTSANAVQVVYFNKV